jgi:hypothetical protein
MHRFASKLTQVTKASISGKKVITTMDVSALQHFFYPIILEETP